MEKLNQLICAMIWWAVRSHWQATTNTPLWYGRNETLANYLVKGEAKHDGQWKGRQRPHSWRSGSFKHT